MNKTGVFPRSEKYDKTWVKENTLGDNPLYLTESLANVMNLNSGERVLELGCGKAVSSIFLAREFGVQIFALDRWIDPSANLQRIKTYKVENQVFPIKADVRNLPFAKNYFDAIISTNSYLYYGSDDRYLPYISQFLKPEGRIGVVDSCFTNEIHSLDTIPQFLKESYHNHWYYVHSLDWWVHHWKKTGIVDIIHADILPESKYITEDFIDTYKDDPDEKEIVDFLKEDTDNFIQTFRLVAQRNDSEIYLEPDERVI